VVNDHAGSKTVLPAESTTLDFAVILTSQLMTEMLS
jgi:hypothetical protein